MATGGFSLCEVVLAMGIFVFALVSVLGLLPTALNAARESLDLSVTTQLANALAQDLHRAKFQALAPGGSPETHFFDDLGRRLSERGGAVYQADVSLGASVSANLILAKITVRRGPATKSFCYLIFNNG